MHMRAALADQPAQVVSGLVVVLPARDALLHLRVEALNAHLKLQRAIGELRDELLQPVRQAVGHHFKMHKNLGRILDAVQKKLQDAHRVVYFQIEGAVYKLEVARAALIQGLDLCHEQIQIKRPRGFVERAQAKLTLEGATARRLHIQQALRQVFSGVLAVRHGQLTECWLLAGNHLHQRLRAIQQGAAEFGKAHISPARNHMVGQAANFLLLHLMANLGSAQHNFDAGPQRFEQPNQLRGFDHVPDVHAQPNHFRLQRQQLFNHAGGRLADHKLTQLRLRAKAGAAMQVHVGQQITQPQRSMDVFGVERGQHNARAGRRRGRCELEGGRRHAGIIEPQPD